MAMGASTNRTLDREYPCTTSQAGHQPRSRETATRAVVAGSRPYGGPMASVKQFQVTFDCAEPERVARFWCEVLGYVVPPPPKGFATWGDFDRTLPPERQGSAFACVDPSGVGPRLFFQRVPEGKVVKNRVHLDVRSAPDWWVMSGWPHSRPNAHDWSRSARPAGNCCGPMASTSRVLGCRTSRATSSVSTDLPRPAGKWVCEDSGMLRRSESIEPTTAVRFGWSPLASDPGRSNSSVGMDQPSEAATQDGSRPMNPTSWSCGPASGGTGTRAPYCPDERSNSSIGSIPASRSAQSCGSSRSS
jgi:Glyoxalase-like domain